MTYQTNRFNHSSPLTEDQLHSMAPSIFATEAHHSRSARFAPIPTIEIVRGMQAEGFLPFRAAQSVTRLADKKDFTKHMIRFRKVDRNDLVVGDNILEIVLVNGNDGSSAYRLEAGIFRIACLNGMVVKSKDYGGVKVRHSGEAMGKVIEGSYEVLKSAERALTAPQDWSKIELSPRQQHAFAIGAHVERFGEEPTTLIKPEALLTARRPQDLGNDLWRTFNRIQENVTRGGLTGYGENANGRVIRRTTRDVKGIDQDMRLNRGLWTMAEYLAEHA